MKFLKTYKLFETGEWSKDIDWQFVKDNPDDDSEETSYIKQMEEILRDIESQILDEGEIDFEIIDIKGYDLYQGPYGKIRINDDIWDIWSSEYGYWIDDFPIDNCSKDGDKRPGFEGDVGSIVDAIIEQYKPINKELRKYNI